MPSRNLIPYLTPARPTAGATYHWKPSPRLRKLGWTNLKLGEDWDTAVAAAVERNREIGVETTSLLVALQRRINRVRRHKAFVDRMLDALERELARQSDKALVYFIGSEKGPIKIGLAINPRKRLAALQTSSHRKLMVLATAEGGYEKEGEYHRRYAHLRLRGEWFQPHPRILAEIELLKIAKARKRRRN